MALLHAEETRPKAFNDDNVDLGLGESSSENSLCVQYTSRPSPSTSPVIPNRASPGTLRQPPARVSTSPGVGMLLTNPTLLILSSLHSSPFQFQVIFKTKDESSKDNQSKVWCQGADLSHFSLYPPPTYFTHDRMASGTCGLGLKSYLVCLLWRVVDCMTFLCATQLWLVVSNSRPTTGPRTQ